MIFFISVLEFSVGVLIGLVAGYYIFIYFQPCEVKDSTTTIPIRPFDELDSGTLQQLLPEIPLWVKNPDYDRVEWMNKFLEYMWPYLDKAICKTAKDVAKPMMEDQLPAYKIDSLKIETLVLGSLPPTFQGMKVHFTNEKELIMEPCLKWAGNPDITLSVKAFGLRTSLQVVDLQFFAEPRITLKPLVPSFPCFAKIYMSLMQKPYVDFGLKLAGADIMSIPALYGYVQELIKDQVSNMYLWPKTLEVQILDPAQAYRRPVGVLHVKVLRATKLKKKDIMGSADPYVKLKLTQDKLPSKKTSVKHSNLNPEWNEEYKFSIRDPESQALEFYVFDWEQVSRHDKMGMAVVPLEEVTAGEPKVMTLELVKDANNPDDKSGGQLEVEMIYKPFNKDEMPTEYEESQTTMQRAPEGTPSGGGLLVVIVRSAEDVEGKHHTNPYVRLTFRGEERKTKHVKKNRDPIWDEEFTFMLEEPPVNEKLHVQVLSSSTGIGLLHPKETLGYVDISLGDVVSNKRINEKYHLIDSKHGRIQIELQWRTAS